jgi:hypothetical protein
VKWRMAGTIECSSGADMQVAGDVTAGETYGEYCFYFFVTFHGMVVLTNHMVEFFFRISGLAPV